MNSPRILGLATGVPDYRYSQSEIFEEFAALVGENLTSRRARAMRLIFERAGVGQRYTSVSRGYYNLERTTQARNEHYMQVAVPLGEATIQRGLAAAGVAPEQVDDLIVVSCTGFSIPGLDLHLAGRLGMRSDLRRSCILGMGCYGAFPGLLRARESTMMRPGKITVVLALELCSLHMQFDTSAESIVSAALFSDGAGVAIVGGEAASGDAYTPTLVDSETHCDYTTLEHMSFNVTDHGFRMYLSSYVPDLLAAQITPFVDRLLARSGLQRGDVRFWGVHPGSTKIVDYVQRELCLSDAQVEHSHSVLYDYGNMSSATILFVLERIQQCAQPSPGDYGVLLAFGPGLTMESLLLRW